MCVLEKHFESELLVISRLSATPRETSGCPSSGNSFLQNKLAKRVALDIGPEGKHLPLIRDMPWPPGLLDKLARLHNRKTIQERFQSFPPIHSVPRPVNGVFADGDREEQLTLGIEQLESSTHRL